MLRTFCSNPALGGFGGGDETAAAASSSSAKATPTPDAFCQIIKELVDNAVDACTVDEVVPTSSGKTNDSSSTAKTTAKRVRVVIDEFKPQHIRADVDENDDDDDESRTSSDNNKHEQILRVTVSDNGCGMADIEKCVGAFHTSKAHNASTTTAAAASGSSDASNTNTDATTTMEAQTAGRYGIGLTLCLLHAQRLVPNSCASIQSAIASDSEWTVVAAVVDTAGDAVRCLPRDSLAKRGDNSTESGTAISILVPGGPTATMAWPRLAEYFARFKLSLGITCSLEVLAPTLSRVPLWVRPTTTNNNNAKANNSRKKKKAAAKKKKKKKSNKKKASPTNALDDIFDSDKWCDQLESDDTERTSDDSSEDDDDMVTTTVSPRARGLLSSAKNDDQGRLGIWKATQLFLGRPVDLENVAHAIVPIRANNKKGRSSKSKKNQASSGPKLEVDVIVHGPDDDDDESDEYAMDEDEGEFGGRRRAGGDYDDDDDDNDGVTTKKIDEASSSASMVLVRMVNKIPLLDSAEAVACGLVQGLASKKRMWNSFGLDVGLKHDAANVGKLPTFEVRDSEQVTPFFKKGAHNLLEKASDDEEEIETEEDLVSNDDESDGGGGNRLRSMKRKRQSKRRHLLPASVRLGNVLVIAQIHAEPTTLPLPTLSKGRLPIDNTAIDDALEVGMTKCLQQLQKTNPNLLLTASELRKAERDARYVPAVSLALASILTKSVTNPDPTIFERIRQWDSKRSVPANIVTMSDGTSSPSPPAIPDPQDGSSLQQQTFNSDDVETLGTLIEGRLRLVLSQPSSAKEKAKTKKKKVAKAAEEKEDDDEEGDNEGDKSDASSVDLGSVDIPWHLLDQNGDVAEKKKKAAKAVEEEQEEEDEKDCDKSDASSVDLGSVDIPWHLLDQVGDTGAKMKNNTKKNAREDAHSNLLESQSQSGMSLSSSKAADGASVGEEYDDWL